MANLLSLLAGFLALPAVIVAVVEPFISLPGNTTVIAFIDLHRSYHDNNTCGDPDWKSFELAYSLEWRTSLHQSSGIDVFDTCGSISRTQRILQEILRQDTCQDTTQRQIQGVLSYVASDVGDFINDTSTLMGLIYVDVKHLMLVSSYQLVNSSMHVLNQTGWTYIATIVDKDGLSQSEHTHFLALSKLQGICVQFSVVPGIHLQLEEIKTPGIVVFASNLTELDQLLQGLQPDISVIIITHDKYVVTLNIKNKLLIVSDGFEPINGLTEYLISEVSVAANGSSRFKDYLMSNHNCTWNASNDNITCEGVSAIKHYFLTRSSELDINRAVYAIDILHEGAANKPKDTPEGTFISLTSVNNGDMNENRIVSFDSYTTFNLDLSQVINSIAFPSSNCSGWCPLCSGCHGNSQYTEDYHHLTGDILITGLFPIRTKGESVFDCGQVAFNTFTDIYIEAFLYALATAQSRYQDLLSNVTIGGLVFDTCSNVNLASQTLLNFESCLYSFENMDNSWTPSPSIVPGYSVPLYEETVGLETFDELGKLSVAVYPNGDFAVNNEKVYLSSRFNYTAVLELLQTMDWSFVGVLTSEDFDKHTIDGFIENSLAKNICIAYKKEISATKQKSIVEAIETVQQYTANVVIFFTNSDAISAFFRTLTYKPLNKVWILLETREDYLDFSSISPPPGAIIFQKKGKQNTDFNQHYAGDELLFAETPWKNMFTAARDSCKTPNCKREIPTAEVWMKAADIIKSVDIILKAVHNAYIKLCPTMEGLCPLFLESGAQKTTEEFEDVVLEYHEETISMSDQDAFLAGYSISNVQINGLVQIGSWSTQGLTLDTNMMKFYSTDGGVRDIILHSHCHSDCHCINNFTVENVTEKFVPQSLDLEMGFVTSSGEFHNKLWTIIVVIIALSGSLITLCLMIYIMCKVCAGALVRRYLVLGLLLLIAMVFLFLSVLPFVFTPTEVGCGMRFFAHGFSYAFAYGIILTKLTTLRDYKYIGLGGEVSRLNQILSVFFITGVQIALGVEWWVLKGSMLIIETNREITKDLIIQDVTYYACDFNRTDFISYHCYVLLLLVICCLYSISVRKETKNMKEARLLLVCSWFCLALWIALIVTFFVLKREYLEAIVAIGILANALSMMVIIYLPKLTAIAKLKYEVSEKKGSRNENGYKIDTDFQFERPYSLPGTMHSTFTDKTTTLPRSLAAFDSSLSY